MRVWRKWDARQPGKLHESVKVAEVDDVIDKFSLSVMYQRLKKKKKKPLMFDSVSHDQDNSSAKKKQSELL